MGTFSEKQTYHFHGFLPFKFGQLLPRIGCRRCKFFLLRVDPIFEGSFRLEEEHRKSKELYFFVPVK